MKGVGIEEEVSVHPVGGMQLSVGYIRMDASRRFIGNLPGMTSLIGDSMEDVLRLMDGKAKAFYGDDVVVEIVPRVATA